MEILGRLRRAVNKLTFLLNLKKFLTNSTWQIASSIRARTLALPGPNGWRRRKAYSFNDRPGLRACIEVVVVDHYHTSSPSSCSSSHNHDDANYDGEEEDNGRRSEVSSGAASPHPPLRRTTSYPLPLETDVDKHAEMFIDNFYRHLLYEKQVSLELRYCSQPGGNSFTSVDEYSIVSPLSSASSQLVSPT
ncbi:hypothetical protein SOVF_165640 [Spinacia oleracea]|nr:hypothetical protein SOVF_165640 [Spinacia oleracea]